MTTQAKDILFSFDALPEAGKYEVALKILRRTKEIEFPSMADDDLIANAEAVFLELDKREINHERPKSW